MARSRRVHHIYSWSASLIVSLLLWRELNPLSLAVGLAVFGLVLFEYGLLRKIAQFRFQSYVAFAAAFARIFFANLAAGEPGVFWSDRMITVAPLVLIFFFVYAQLPGSEETSPAIVASASTPSWPISERPRWRCFYFQFQDEWVVTAYAAPGVCSCLPPRGRSSSDFLAPGNSSHARNFRPWHGPQSFRSELL